MKKLAVVFAALSMVAMVGCSTFESKKEEAVDYPTLVKQANASITKARSIGGEWRDSAKLLKKAAKAEKAGKMEKAIKLAKRAKFEGEMGYKQAKNEKKAGPWLF